MNAPTEPIDTTTSGGGPIFPVFGALAECERDIIRERTRAGMAEGWRPKKLGAPTKMAMVRHLSADHSHAIADICTSPGISRATRYRYLGTPGYGRQTVAATQSAVTGAKRCSPNPDTISD
jgi:DNA invertase Pin-like site-specific DNA recombinase